MLLHVSLEADDPRRLAVVIAELWGGEAFAFPIASDDGWMAVAGDERGSMIEVLPRGTELREGEGVEEAIGVIGPLRRFSAQHVAMDTALEEEAVFAIGAREGWTMKVGPRVGGAFSVIETWVDGCLMIELMTPPMGRAYRRTITLENCRRLLAPAGAA